MNDTRFSAPLSSATVSQPVSPGTPEGRAVPVAERVAALSVFLTEHKAEDVACLELGGENAFAEAMLVATAGSMRQAQALADGVAGLCRERGFECLRIEGYAAAQWILVDCNDIIVHILLGPARELYRLEDLWGRAAQGRAVRSAASASEDRP